MANYHWGNKDVFLLCHCHLDIACSFWWANGVLLLSLRVIINACCPCTTLKNTKPFPNLPVSKLSAGKPTPSATEISSTIRSTVYQEGWSQGWMQFYGTATSSCSLWHERYRERSSSHRGFPGYLHLLTCSSSEWMWGSQRILSAVALEATENFILPSFLNTVFLRDRWNLKCISSPGLNSSFHWKITSDRRMLSSDCVNPQ